MNSGHTAAEPASIRIFPVAFPLILCVFGYAFPAIAQQTTYETVGRQVRLEMLQEAMGLFWIGAELAILFCILTARRIFETHPVPTAIALTPRERRRAIVWSISFAMLVLLVLGRYVVLPTLADAYASLDGAYADVRAAAESLYYAHTHRHVAIWCTFITGWVLLEIAIVVQGIAAYRALRCMLMGETRA